MSILLVSDREHVGPGDDSRAREWMEWTGQTDLRLMSDEAVRVEPDDDEIAEEWIRWTNEPWLRGVDVCRLDKTRCWVVGIMAQEFWRSHQPLGAELRQRVRNALRAVEGVTAVYEHDNETWDVTGTSSGQALIRATARVMDDRASRLRPGG